MYNRVAAVEYALQWALSFNPQYYNFTSLGGDCTNFVSQCLHHGGIPMNYAQYGWYYVDLSRRAPAWTGVEELWNFGVSNTGTGLYLSPCTQDELQEGDIIQLGRQSDYYHTLIVTEVRVGALGRAIYVSAHDYAARNVPLTQYAYQRLRCAKVRG